MNVKASQEDRARLETALEIAELGTWEYDPITDRVRGDSRFAEIFGFAPESAVTSEQVYEAIHPDDWSYARERVESARRSGEPYSAEYRIFRNDGACRWVVVRGKPIVAADGRGPDSQRFIGTVMDVTVHREQEAKRLEALQREQESAALLQSLLDAAPIGIGFWDRELRFRMLNSRLAEINGLPPEAHIDRRPDELLPGLQGLDEILQQWRRVMETGQPLLDVEVRGRTHADAAGERIWIEDFFPVRSGDEIIGLGAAVEDVTARRRAEEALRHSESRYRALFESIDDGFCIIESILDEDGRGIDHRFLEMNPAFERHTGLSNALGRTAREMVPDLEDRWPETYGRVAVTRVAERFIDNSEAMGRWFDVFAFPVDEPAQRRVALLFRDITTKKRFEERQCQDAESKDRFLATLAHELRNPLAPLRTGLDVLSLADGDANARQRVLEMMQRQMAHLVRLVDDLLDLARVTRGKVRLDLETCEIRHVINQAVEVSATDGVGIRHITVDVPDEPVLIRCDKVRLVQVFVNLLNNACKFTLDNGQISVRVHAEHDRVRIAVRDDGVGIPKEDVEKVFDLFHQGAAGSHHGLGIGLTLVRDLVRLHEGTVEAFSAGLGQGAEFVVTLPLANSGGFEDPAYGGKTEASSATVAHRVLVVDDSRDAAESLSMLLGVMGATVETANEGRSALRRLMEFQPHMVLLDIGMPDMDGYEVAGAIRAALGDDSPLLVAVTGWGSDADKARAKAAGFDDHLTKPVEVEALHRLLARLR